MDTVKLKSKLVTSFRQRVLSTNEYGKRFYEVRNFEFNIDNNCKCDVPVHVWEDLKNKKFNEEFLYKDIFKPL
jgi:hypothetical protein